MKWDCVHVEVQEADRTRDNSRTLSVDAYTFVHQYWPGYEVKPNLGSNFESETILFLLINRQEGEEHEISVD